MKKSVIVGIIAAILLISVLFVSSISAKEAKNFKIEQKVLDEIGQDGKVRVIVVLKDSGQDSKNSNIMQNSADKIGNEKIKHKFESMNAFSASLSAKDIEKLENDANVEAVYYDTPVFISLQDSVPLINATNAWNLQSSGVNLTGKGETICIIDTGIDYTHPDLGNCTPVNLTLSGTNESYINESIHNYTNNYEYTLTITKEGYSQIAVHFVNISTEANFDYVEILDGNSKLMAVYSGNHQNLWTPSTFGNTIYVKLKTDSNIVDYGFYIDQVINGTTNTTYNWSACSKIVGGWDIRNGDPNPMDDNGHGTHVAGIAAANGTIKGVAPEAKIVALKTQSASGSGTSSDVIEAIEWCVNRSSEFNISVISISLGADCDLYPSECYATYCDSGDSLTSAAVNAAVAKNISVLIAAGNDGNKTHISSPSCMQNATPIGASTKADAIASYSNRNSLVELLAPGSSINSTKRNGGYELKDGTSMATPHVAGAFAIINQFLRASGQIKTPQEIESAFNATGKIIYDSGSGLNFSRINVYDAIISLDSSNPSVNLISPDNNLINNSAVSLNITFECNATDNLGLKNLTFYLWNSTGIYNQTFSSLSGASDDFELNITKLQEGAYEWNCLVYDLSGNSVFASSNYSIDYDTTAPSISLISPSEGYSTTGTTIDFEYNTTGDTNIANCGLIINNAIDSYNSSAITNLTNTISKNLSLLSIGSYTWSVNCTDKAGNVGNSSSRSLIITEAATRSSGGGGGVLYLTYNITNEQLSEGYTNSLRKGDKIKFSSNSKNHSLTVDYVGTNFANITIRSNATTLALKIGESAKLNLSSKYYYDLLVKLEGIANNKANITIKSIYEEIAPAEENKSVPIPPSYDISENKSNDKTYSASAINNANQNYTTSSSYVKIIIFILAGLALLGFAVYLCKKKIEERSLRKSVNVKEF